MQWIKSFLESILARWRAAPPPPVPAEPPPEAQPVEPQPEPAAEPPPEEPDDEPEEKQVRKKRGRYIGKLRGQIADDVSEVLDLFKGLQLRNAEDPEGARAMEAALGQVASADAIFYDPDLIDNEATRGGGKYGVLNPEGSEAELAEASWPLDISACMHLSRGTGWKIYRLRSIPPRELRGRAKIVPARVASLTLFVVERSGKWWAEEVPVGIMGNRWVTLDSDMVTTNSDSMRGPKLSKRNLSKENMDTNHRIAAMLSSLQLTSRYWWHAALSTGPGMPRILIPTNPAGCLALFKNRAAAPGETRRKALRHWVEKHYRDDDAGLTFVRDHLRGATEFQWHDLQCDLLVSEFDLEKNELFRREADEWRTRRKHNVFRVRLKAKKP